jgi:Zn-dependent peptidase ImmA (M78 family)
VSSLTFSRSSLDPLDPRLRLLIGEAWDPNNTSLAVRRFVREIGMDCPSKAMKMATDMLLFKYGTQKDREAAPIAVEKLCEIYGASVTGIRPKSRDANVYSIDSWQSRQGHTGRVSFDGSRALIAIPESVDYPTARLSVAHELGHLLIHRRGEEHDEVTLRLGSSPAEEALAEYAARLLLIPSGCCEATAGANLAEFAITQASRLRVTIHCFVERLGDPDVASTSIQGAILWRMRPDVAASEPLYARLTPQWHLCRDAFVPIRKCKARPRSLVAHLAEAEASKAMSRREDVSIGSFAGHFRVDAFAWGSVDDGTRLILSVFRDVSGSD